MGSSRLMSGTISSSQFISQSKQTEWQCFRDTVFVLMPGLFDQTATECHLFSRRHFIFWLVNANVVETGTEQMGRTEKKSVLVCWVRETFAAVFLSTVRSVNTLPWIEGCWMRRVFGGVQLASVTLNYHFILSQTQRIANESSCEIEMATRLTGKRK